ncbi:Serine/threonine protein kinase-related protein [Planctopirus limnophila DSM 3776]|uniref:non-specific serine/threonine protein kinase n=1 Tax=Planctopirus limnophila (strain ATCC 43296 / DSM 3776 / IFAM 1008 / Mu 290) TaxID=521674 RepID=D5SMV3_PLAL2|nr:serine/threonine-protein kinase [Planctopirus limnophila]ADG68008.1 Serine/threonine protein kinase-related protein [Planctopirus limnophila DSM 3776]
MPAKLSSESFLATVRRSGLIEDDRLNILYAEYAERLNGEADSTDLAQFLVNRNAVTAWQGEKLLQGKHKGFFLGKYRLLSLLGRGGMSSVYLAEHIVMRRRCAIKVLPQKRVSDTSYLGRFHREAQAVASLDHPNIVRAYDVDHQADRDTDIHFLVMEFVDGQSLQELVLKSGQVPFADAADYIRQAALGLSHAHGAGLVHRDIKPGNLLVDHTGVVKVLDLGLARFFSDTGDDALTIQHDEKVLGTADYLAPEQALDSHSVDARADIYSLGCTLYFLLTGSPPFTEGTLAQRLMAHQTKQPPSIESKRPDVPVELAAIVRKMMAKSPGDRPASAMAVAETLENWLKQYRSGEVSSGGVSVESDVLQQEDAHPAAVAGLEFPPREPLPTDMSVAPAGDELSAFLTSLSGGVSTPLPEPVPQRKTPEVAKPSTDSAKGKKSSSSTGQPVHDFQFLEPLNHLPEEGHSSKSSSVFGAEIASAPTKAPSSVKLPSSKTLPANQNAAEASAAKSSTDHAGSKSFETPVPPKSASGIQRAAGSSKAALEPPEAKPVATPPQIVAASEAPILEAIPLREGSGNSIPEAIPVRRTAKVIRPAATTPSPTKVILEAIPISNTDLASEPSQMIADVEQPIRDTSTSNRNSSSRSQSSRHKGTAKKLPGWAIPAGIALSVVFVLGAGYTIFSTYSTPTKTVDYSRPDPTWIDRRETTVGPQGEFKKISDALAKVRANFKPGGEKDRFRIEVAAGIYPERIVLDSRGSGRKWPENITVAGAENAKVVIQGGTQTGDPIVKIRDVQGFQLENITINAEKHETAIEVGDYLYGTRLTNLSLLDFSNAGIIGKDVSGLLDKEFTINDCLISTKSEKAVGVRLEAKETLADVSLLKNRFHGPMAAGVLIEASSFASKIQIRENRFFECDNAIEFAGEASWLGIAVSNNTIAAGNQGVVFTEQPGSDSVTLSIRRNLFAGLKGAEIRIQSNFSADGWKKATEGRTQGNVTDRLPPSPAPGVIDLANSGGSRVGSKISFKSMEPTDPNFLVPATPAIPKPTDNALERELNHTGAIGQ